MHASTTMTDVSCPSDHRVLWREIMKYLVLNIYIYIYIYIYISQQTGVGNAAVQLCTE